MKVYFKILYKMSVVKLWFENKINLYNDTFCLVLEWIDYDVIERVIIVVLDLQSFRINITDSKKVLLRFIDVKAVAEKNNSLIEIHLSSDRDENLLSVKLPREHDLVRVYLGITYT